MPRPTAPRSPSRPRCPAPASGHPPPPHTGAARQPRTLRCPPSPGLAASALTVSQPVLGSAEPAHRAADLVRGGEAEKARLPAFCPHHTRRPFSGDSGTDRSRGSDVGGASLAPPHGGRGRRSGRCRGVSDARPSSPLCTVPLFKRDGDFACLVGLGLDVLFV